MLPWGAPLPSIRMSPHPSALVRSEEPRYHWRSQLLVRSFGLGILGSFDCRSLLSEQVLGGATWELAGLSMKGFASALSSAEALAAAKAQRKAHRVFLRYTAPHRHS